MQPPLFMRRDFFSSASENENVATLPLSKVYIERFDEEKLAFMEA